MRDDALSLDGIVEILVDLDVVAFDEPGPWPGPPDEDDQVCDVDLDGVWPSAWQDPVAAPSEEPTDVGEFVDRWGEVGARVRSVASRGPYQPPPILDALAWYLPLHFFGVDSAIYLRESALFEVAGLILQRLPEARRFDADAVQGACRSAYTVLFLHEAFHHKAESFAIRAEVVERVPRYVPYTRTISSPLLRQGSDDVVEEALACAEMLSRLDEPTYKRGVPDDVRRATKMFVRWFVPTLGPSYRRGVAYLGAAFGRGLHTMLSQIQEAKVSPERDAAHWMATPNLHRGLLNIKTLTRVVIPIGEEPLIPWFTPAFRGTISSRDAERLLTQHFGYRVERGRGKGSHIWLESPAHPPLSLPANRKALSPGVVKSIAVGVGLRPQELVDLNRTGGLTGPRP